MGIVRHYFKKKRKDKAYLLIKVSILLALEYFISSAQRGERSISGIVIHILIKI